MSSSDDFKDFWTEYQLHQENKVKDDSITDDFVTKQDEDDGEQDVELLRAMGMGHLSEAFRSGQEVTDAELDESLRQLSVVQADTVRRRVRSLNHTIRTRRRHVGARQPRSGWNRKPDIREVFRDVETSSTGTRSRSATPDSLDSVGNLAEADQDATNPWSPPGWDNIRQSSQPSLIGSVPSFVKIFDNPAADVNDTSNITILDQQDSMRLSIGNKESLRRTPSAPPSCHRSSAGSTPASYPPVLPPHEMFRRPRPWATNLYRVDVASNTEGIELLGYNRIGTIHLSRPSRERVRSGSDPTTAASTIRLSHLKLSNSDIRALVDSSSSHGLTAECSSVVRSQNSLYMPVTELPASSEPISFETIFHQNVNKPTDWIEDNEIGKTESRISVTSLKDLDFRDLKPFLWLEVCAIFDKYSITIRKRKPLKRKRKEDGNVFGVNLSTLVMRDYQLLNDNSSVPVPLIFRTVLSQLSGVGARDEGILRIAGHRQKVEILCNEVENNFYSKSNELRILFKRASSHDMTAVLKRLLRDLPQPLLTVELIDLFYQSHGVACEEDQTRLLNLLVLLLPIENRSTLYALLEFFVEVVNCQDFNKMNLHNVAMIMAPSLFPPRYVHPNDKSDLSAQILMAATCCHVVERLINAESVLRTVPSELLIQARRCNRDALQRKRRKDQKNVKLSMKGRKDLS